MKKIIALFIAVLMVSFVLASCKTNGGDKETTTTKKPTQTTTTTTTTTTSTTKGETTSETTTETTTPVNPTLALSDIIDKIYEKYPVQLMMLATTEINMDDAKSSEKEVVDAFYNSLKYVTGLESAEGISEVSYSGPMIGSQAYSLVLVRVDDASKAEATAKSMLAGINPGKWICVQADLVRACTKGDVIMMVLIDSELEYSDTEMVSAFSSVMGGTDVNIKK